MWKKVIDGASNFTLIDMNAGPSDSLELHNNESEAKDCYRCNIQGLVELTFHYFIFQHHYLENGNGVLHKETHTRKKEIRVLLPCYKNLVSVMIPILHLIFFILVDCEG